MKILNTLSRASLIGLTTLLIGTGASLEVSATSLNDEALARWKATYDELREMNPKWGKQGVEAFKASMDAGVPILFLDIRTPGELQEGIIEGALMIELNQLPTKQGLAKLPVDRNTIIGVYCKAKHRSTLALGLLHQLGYKNAIDMEGGITAWRAAGYPLVAVPE